jgi:hypothetical protein
MPYWITAFAIPAATFVLGLAIRHLFDRLGKRSDYRQANREQQSKHKREAYLSFLKALESIMISEDAPPGDSLRAAREKFVQIEIDGSDEIILVSGMLLGQLERQARGIKTSHDHLTPTHRKYFLELVRSELQGRKPDLREIESEFLQDPLFAMLAGIPTEPKPTVLFDYDARGVAKKDAKNDESKKS